ncbi:CopG family transcriptional regulator, partial [Dysosmobacter welbionis]
MEFGEQVRPPFHSALVALLFPPGSHLTVVTGEQDLRHCSTVPFSRAGVLGIFQQPVPVGF